MIIIVSNNLERIYINQAFQEDESLYELLNTYKTVKYSTVIWTTYSM